MALVISRALRVGPVGTYELPVIGYENLLESGVVVGVPVTDAANAYDWLTYDGWTTNAAGGTLTLTLTGSEPADYFAFCAHDLHDHAATIKLEYKQGLGAWTDVPGTETIPGDARPIVKLFDQIAADQWRVTIATGGTAATLGVVSFGLKLQLQRGAYIGFMPPRFGRVDKYLNAKSHGGEFLGRSLTRTGMTGTLALDHLTAGWVRDYLEPFLLHSRTRAWFLLWNPDRRPDEATYCLTTGMPQPSNTGPGHMGVQIGFEGKVE